MKRHNFTKILFLFLSFQFIFYLTSFSQDKKLVDSLSLVLQNTNEDTLKIKLLNDLAWEHKFADMKKSFEYADEALLLSEKINYKAGIAKGYILKGVFNTIQGNYEDAIIQYDSCRMLREELHDSVGIAAILNNIGTVHNYQGNLDKALDYFLRSLNIEESFGNNVQNIAEGYQNVGNVYLAMKKYEMALKYYFRYLDLFKESKKSDINAEAYNNIGNVYALKGINDSALYFLNEGLKIGIATNNKEAQSIAYSGLGQMYYNQKQLNKALSSYQHSLSLDEELGNPQGEATDLIHIADTYTEMNNFEKGIEAANKCLDIAKKIGVKESIANAYLLLAQCYNGLKQDSKAYDYQELYIQYHDSMLNEKSDETIAEMQTRFETVRKDAANKLLKEENSVKDLQIARSKTLRIILISSILLILLFSYLFYSRYKLKQKEILNAEIMKEREQRSKAVIEAEERERMRIAKDLHDGIGQTLSAAKMNLSNLEANLKSITDEQKMMIQNSLELVDESVKEVRSVSHNMMPNALLKVGLAKAVRDFISKLNTQSIKIDLEIVGLNDRLETTIETVLYRVIQENVSNIIKHSKANHVNLQLIKHDNEIVVMIEDNGVGFDTNKLNDFEGIGLKNIQSRVAFLNGTVNFDSTPGRGTIVTIEVPL